MISSKIYQNQIDSLQKAFNQKYTEEQLKRLFLSLQGKEERHLKKAVDWLVLNKTRLPFPGEVIMAVSEETSRDWQNKKIEERKQAGEFFTRPKKTPMATEALVLIKNILSKKISKTEAYIEIDKLDIKYPRINWQKAKWDKAEVPF